MIVSEGKEKEDDGEIKKNSSLSGGCFLLSTARQSITPPKAEGEGRMGLLHVFSSLNVELGKL